MEIWVGKDNRKEKGEKSQTIVRFGKLKTLKKILALFFSLSSNPNPDEMSRFQTKNYRERPKVTCAYLKQ